MPDVDRGCVVRDWRDRASYADTQRLPSEAWAWEFLRCNPEYCAVSRNHENARHVTESRRWGLVTLFCAEYRGRPLWRPEVSPSVMRFRGSVDAIVARLSLCRTTIVRERDGVVHLLAQRAGLAIQLVVEPLRHSSTRELMLVIPDRPDAARRAAKSMVVFAAMVAVRMPMQSGLGPRPNHRLMIVLQVMTEAPDKNRLTVESARSMILPVLKCAPARFPPRRVLFWPDALAITDAPTDRLAAPQAIRSPHQEFDGTWVRFAVAAAAVLASEPLCRVCAANGRVTAATEVDHIVSKSHGGSDDIYNLQAICIACHRKKSQSEALREHFARRN